MQTKDSQMETPTSAAFAMSKENWFVVMIVQRPSILNVLGICLQSNVLEVNGNAISAKCPNMG